MSSSPDQTRGPSSLRGCGCFAAGVGACLLAVAGMIVLTVLWLPSTPAPPTLPLPDPNGYEDFLAASEMIQPGTQPEDVYEADLELLRSYVEANASALARARAGLARESRVLEPPTNTPTGGGIERLNHLRDLGRLLFASGRLAALEGRTQDAARNYLDVVRYGTQLRRGSISLDFLVGVAVATMGEEGLSRIIEELPATTCAEIQEDLRRIEENLESPDDFLMRDRAYFQRSMGLMQRVMIKVAGVNRAAQDAAVQRAALQEHARYRLLRTRLAIRRFRLEHERLPEGLAELVPEYLDAVPEDPFSDEPIKYQRRQDDSDAEGGDYELLSTTMENEGETGAVEPIGPSTNGPAMDSESK